MDFMKNGFWESNTKIAIGSADTLELKQWVHQLSDLLSKHITLATYKAALGGDEVLELSRRLMMIAAELRKRDDDKKYPV